MMTVIKNFLTRNAGVTQIESGRHLTVSTRVTFMQAHGIWSTKRGQTDSEVF